MNLYESEADVENKPINPKKDEIRRSRTNSWVPPADGKKETKI